MMLHVSAVPGPAEPMAAGRAPRGRPATAAACTRAARVPAGTQHAQATGNNQKFRDFLSTRALAECYSAKAVIIRGLTLDQDSGRTLPTRICWINPLHMVPWPRLQAGSQPQQKSLKTCSRERAKQAQVSQLWEAGVSH